MAQPYYYITWNPAPKLFPYLSPQTWFDSTWPHFVKLVHMFEDWGVSPEWKNQRLHYHGFFSFKPKQRQWRKCLQELQKYGFVTIAKVRLHLDTTYMRKDNDDMEQILGIHLPIFTEVPLQKNQIDGPIEMIETLE